VPDCLTVPAKWNSPSEIWFRQHLATHLISLGDYTALTEVRDRAGEPELCQELVRVLAESR
jgi:hypothetical protein